MTTRILTIGDSKTAWNQTPNFLTFAQAWPGQMQTVLQGAGHTVSVVNPAVSGSSAGTAGHSPWMPTATGTLGSDWYAGVDAVDDVRYTAYLAALALTHNDLAFGSSAAFVQDRLLAIAATLVQRNYRVMLTTALPSGSIVGSAETARQAINAWILGRTHGYFVSDFNLVPQAALINDTTWYSDTTHPTAALAALLGAQAAADVSAQGLA